MHDSQASLVNALQSIHTLLEESETKLNAAKESLAGSRIENQKHHTPSQAKTLSDPLPDSPLTPKADSGKSYEKGLAVPILEDIVLPGIQQEPLPLLDETGISDSRRQEFIDKLEAIQIEMDDYLNEMLVRCMAGIELELKETLSRKFKELQEIIEK